MLIQGKLLTPIDDLKDVYDIRREVFVQELKQSEESEADNLDNEAMHVIVYEEGNSIVPVATGRILYDGIECRIDKIAVLQKYRGLKYGDFTVRMLLSKAFSAGIKEVTLTSPASLVGFFQQIGFTETDENGDEQVNGSISMAINAQNIATCCRISK